MTSHIGKTISNIKDIQRDLIERALAKEKVICFDCRVENHPQCNKNFCQCKCVMSQDKLRIKYNIIFKLCGCCNKSDYDRDAAGQCHFCFYECKEKCIR